MAADLKDFLDQLPPEMQAEAMALERRKTVQDALAAQGYAIPKGRYEDYQGKLQDLATRYQGGLSGAVQDYANKRNGGTFNRPVGPEDMGTNWSGSLDEQDIPRRPETVMGDKRGAAHQAIASGYGPLVKTGFEDLKSLKGNELTSEDILKLPNFDPKDLVKVAQLVAQGVPQERAIAALSAGGKGLPEGWESKIPAGVKRGSVEGQYYLPNTQGGGEDLYELVYDRGQFRGSRKLDNAPRVSTTTTVNQAGPKSGAAEYFKQGAKTVDELGDRARAAQDVSTGLALLKNRDQQGVFSNVTTGPATFMTNLAQIAGVPLSQDQLSKLGNTENYNSISIDLWQNLVAKFGGNRGVTKEEAEQIKQILPQTRQSPQARQELYQILEHLAQKQISRFRVANAAFGKALAADNPEIWAQHIGETMLPTTPFMPATAPERNNPAVDPRKFGGRRVE